MLRTISLALLSVPAPAPSAQGAGNGSPALHQDAAGLQGDLFWHTDLAMATAEAERERRPLLAVFR